MSMAAAKPLPLTEHDLQGFTYLRFLGPLCAPLRPAGTERERAGNRPLCSDQYAALMLLDFLHPTGTSLRGLPQTTTLPKGQERLSIRRTSPGALREAAYVCDAALLPEVMTELGAPLPPALSAAEPAALAPRPAGDGRQLPALPPLAQVEGQ
jgi:hypothetical protein